MGRFAVFVIRVAWSLALCGLAGGGALAAELKLSWEVVQPFRFFRYPSDQAVQEWAYQDVVRAGTSPDRIVSAMENTLNSVAWWKGRPAGSQKSRADMLDDLRRFEEKQLNRPFVTFDPRLGWASALRSGVGTSPALGTCWDPAEKTHRGCVSDIGQMSGRKNNDYLMPKRHMVSLRVMERTASGWKPHRGKCAFILITKPKAGFGLLPDPLSRSAERQRIEDADCGIPVYLRTEYKTSNEVSAEVEDGTILRTGVAVKDILVVGVGDSFASGEGNPEVPAVLDEQQGISPYVPVSRNIVNPAQDNVIIPTRKRTGDGRIAGGTAARWLDDQCHRSIYSAQARTAIALAFEGNRHHAVTFVSFACSGAEITDGLFWPQDHRECESNTTIAGPRLYQPQLSAVVDALSGGGANYRQFPVRLDASDRYASDVIAGSGENGPREFARKIGLCLSWPNGLKIANPPVLKSGVLDRKIDLLLVSFGGNDIGFGPLVSKAVINSGLLDVDLGLFSLRAIRIYQAAVGAIRLDKAKQRIRILETRFEYMSRALQQKLEMRDPSRIIVSAYPRLSKTDTGFCRQGNFGMNVSTLFSVVERRGADSVTAKDADDIVTLLNDKIGSIAVNNGWRFARNHVNRFQGHSFCDADDETLNARSSQADRIRAGVENLDLPHRRVTPSTTEWQPYNPATEFYPYEKRKRWVRTFNDAYLLSNYFKGEAIEQGPVYKDKGIYQGQRALGGPMHPTAEGHAHMADGLLLEARKALFVNGEVR